MNSIAAKAELPAACIMPMAEPAPSRTALMDGVGRMNAIRELSQAADGFADTFANTGCLAALGDLHRCDRLLMALIDGEGRAG